MRVKQIEGISCFISLILRYCLTFIEKRFLIVFGISIFRCFEEINWEFKFCWSAIFLILKIHTKFGLFLMWSLFANFYVAKSFDFSRRVIVTRRNSGLGGVKVSIATFVSSNFPWGSKSFAQENNFSGNFLTERWWRFKIVDFR